MTTKKQDKDEKAAAPPGYRDINLSPLAAADAFQGTNTAVQGAIMDLETKKVFEILIREIRAQVAGGGGGGGEGGAGGVSQADFDALKTTVKSDLTALGDSIMLMNQTLDADTGVATTTYAETCNPPPLETE